MLGRTFVKCSRPVYAAPLASLSLRGGLVGGLAGRRHSPRAAPLAFSAPSVAGWASRSLCASHHPSPPAPQCLVGSSAPDFTADAVMADGSIAPVTLSSYRNSRYVCLLFYPLDFTFVCPSELLAFNQEIETFEKLNVQVNAHCHPLTRGL
eukprot:GHVT01006092.1.p1 GENE.GHVT01006092.1~~GHVT01006092.1.p1  ORF type:complete len:151 (-),score=21.07 GHVT01006092.1:511-963(-)